MPKETKQAKSLSLEELSAKERELEGQLFKLRMQKATGQLGDLASIRIARKELARVKTFQTQKAGKSKAAVSVKGK
jgi:large subunit ribosomal protein L29